MRVFLKFLAVFTVLAAVSCEVYYEEKFTDGECTEFALNIQFLIHKYGVTYGCAIL